MDKKIKLVIYYEKGLYLLKYFFLSARLMYHVVWRCDINFLRRKDDRYCWERTSSSPVLKSQSAYVSLSCKFA